MHVIESIGTFCKRMLLTGFMESDKLARKRDVLNHKLNRQKQLKKVIDAEKLEKGKLKAIASKDFPFVPAIKSMESSLIKKPEPQPFKASKPVDESVDTLVMEKKEMLLEPLTSDEKNDLIFWLETLNFHKYEKGLMK